MGKFGQLECPRVIWPTRNFTIVDKNEAAGAAVARLARMRALTGIGQSTLKSVHCSIAPQTPRRGERQKVGGRSVQGSQNRLSGQRFLGSQNPIDGRFADA